MSEELIEQVARAIAPAAWEVGEPIPTREAVIAYHSARQDSIVAAKAAIAAINLPTQLEAAHTQGWNEAIDAVADWFADRFSDAVQADCESGVKWLNERAAKAYLKDAPATLAAIREGEDAIRALTKENSDASSD